MTQNRPFPFVRGPFSVGCLVAAALLAAPSAVSAQEESDEQDVNFSLQVNTDTFFGLAPMATGALGLSDTLAFTFYGIYWSGGAGADWGNWAEFGAGVNIALGGVSINPQRNPAKAPPAKFRVTRSSCGSYWRTASCSAFHAAGSSSARLADE
jgi:hypothetical protein